MHSVWRFICPKMKGVDGYTHACVLMMMLINLDCISTKILYTERIPITSMDLVRNACEREQRNLHVDFIGNFLGWNKMVV